MLRIHRPRTDTRQLLVYCLVILAVMSTGFIIIASRAATSSISLEAEKGSASAGASVIPDTTASGGSAAVFKSPAQPLPTTRYIDWSGYSWEVRDNDWNDGAPMFNDNWELTNIVRGTTVNDPLTMKITNPTGTAPYAAQIATRTSLGYGTYTLHASGPFDTMDKSIVFGSLFTFDPTTPNNPGYNEIDTAEISRWGNINNAYPFQVVKQTYYTNTNEQISLAGNGFPWPNGLRDATFQLSWHPGSITLTIYKGGSTAAADILVSNTSTGSKVPTHAAEKLYINAWVYQYSRTGEPASSVNVPNTAFTLHSFTHVP